MGRVSYGFFTLFSIFQSLTGHTPPTRHILRICPSHPTPHADTMASGGGSTPSYDPNEVIVFEQGGDFEGSGKKIKMTMEEYQNLDYYHGDDGLFFVGSTPATGHYKIALTPAYVEAYPAKCLDCGTPRAKEVTWVEGEALCPKCFEVSATETITFVDGGDWQEGIPYMSYSKITKDMLNELTSSGATKVTFRGQVPEKELFVLKKEQLDSIIKLVPVDKLDKFKAIVAGSVRGCGCLNAECLTCQCDTCGECLDQEVKTCHHAKFGKFCKCSPEPKQGE